MINGPFTPYPTYYAEKMMQYFVRGGDSVLGATSDYLLLSAYAAQRTNGALTMLVINKDTTTNFNAQIVLTNYVPWTNATIQSYGIPQDQAVENNVEPPCRTSPPQTSRSPARTSRGRSRRCR